MRGRSQSALQSWMAPHPLQPIVRRATAGSAPKQRGAPKVVAPPGGGTGAHRRGATWIRVSKAACTRQPRCTCLRRIDSMLRRGGGSRTDNSAGNPAGKLDPAPNAPATGLGPAAPNDSRVRGAGPAHETFVRPKTWTAPHPLQPIVRRPRRAFSRTGRRHVWSASAELDNVANRRGAPELDSRECHTASVGASARLALAGRPAHGGLPPHRSLLCRGG